MQTERQRKIGDSAMRVLATLGARGLTHRAVDLHAGLPPGSTSYYANRRAELLQFALNTVMDKDREYFQLFIAPGVGVDLDGLLEKLSAPENRELALARFELFLEAARNTEFRRLLEDHRRNFIGLATMALEQQGMKEPRAAAVKLITEAEGRLFQALVFGSVDWLENS